MMVKSGGTLVEPACVPRVWKTELLEIEMVTELVAKGARECAERSDLLAYRRSHPDADKHGVGGVVAKEFECPMLAGA